MFLVPRSGRNPAGVLSAEKGAAGLSAPTVYISGAVAAIRGCSPFLCFNFESNFYDVFFMQIIYICQFVVHMLAICIPITGV